MDYVIDKPVTSSSGLGRSDARGLSCSTGSAAAVDALEPALDAMLSYFGNPLAALDQVSAADPGGLIRRCSRPRCCWAAATRSATSSR